MPRPRREWRRNRIRCGIRPANLDEVNLLAGAGVSQGVAPAHLPRSPDSFVGVTGPRPARSICSCTGARRWRPRRRAPVRRPPVFHAVALNAFSGSGQVYNRSQKADCGQSCRTDRLHSAGKGGIGLLTACSPDGCAPFVCAVQQGFTGCWERGDGGLSPWPATAIPTSANHRNPQFRTGMISTVGEHVLPSSSAPLNEVSTQVGHAPPARDPGRRVYRTRTGSQQ